MPNTGDTSSTINSQAGSGPRTVRAPRGTALTAKSWLTEAPIRMIMNNLDPDVAEKPDELIVYGGIGKAARNWECFDRIVETLKNLDEDETLLVQSGKPVGVFKIHPGAALGNLGGFPRTRPQGPDDVRPDDCRFVDLHRQPGYHTGDV